ncbi:hypothetical protein PanWU01x14_303140 [Parasponia andersonii]|uniref:Uncharacterized protein n=1 Tax=Parasponia andersonii TaxID=3476 RepID=A0A2P5AT03_PARAD|nr:hypothetical protein PanWU01x14_303140 [Parasponia andersonii]
MTTNRTSWPVLQPVIDTIGMEYMVTNRKNLTRFAFFEILQTDDTLITTPSTRTRPSFMAAITYQWRQPIQGPQPRSSPFVDVSNKPLQHANHLYDVVLHQGPVKRGLMRHVGVVHPCSVHHVLCSVWPHVEKPRKDAEENLVEKSDAEGDGEAESYGG